MIAYEVYWREKGGDKHLIGILPERRKNSERITEESILNWGRKVAGDSVAVKNINFVKIENWLGLIMYLWQLLYNNKMEVLGKIQSKFRIRLLHRVDCFFLGLLLGSVLGVATSLLFLFLFSQK